MGSDGVVSVHQRHKASFASLHEHAGVDHIDIASSDALHKIVLAESTNDGPNGIWRALESLSHLGVSKDESIVAIHVTQDVSEHFARVAGEID